MLNKLRLGFFCIVFLNFVSVKACDNCNVFLSINPNDYQNSIGLTYRTRYHFGSFDQYGSLHLKHGGADVVYQNEEISENYRRLELSGNYYWSEKWKVQVIMPYISNVQSTDGLAKFVVKGIGDPMIIQNFQVFNTKNLNDTISLTQRWEIGVGAKVPLGSISSSFPNGTPNIDLQAGTGSWDILLTTSYIAKFKNVGWSTQVNYKLNTANKDQFQYGNTLNLQSSLFYIKSFSRMTLMPMVGVYSEIFENEKIQKIETLDTGGSLWFMDFGINVFINKIRITGNFQPNVSSVLKDDLALPVKNRFAVGVNYTF